MNKLKSTNTTVILEEQANYCTHRADVDGNRKEGMDKCQVRNIIYDT